MADVRVGRFQSWAAGQLSTACPPGSALPGPCYHGSYSACHVHWGNHRHPCPADPGFTPSWPPPRVQILGYTRLNGWVIVWCHPKPCWMWAVHVQSIKPHDIKQLCCLPAWSWAATNRPRSRCPTCRRPSECLESSHLDWARSLLTVTRPPHQWCVVWWRYRAYTFQSTSRPPPRVRR